MESYTSSTGTAHGIHLMMVTVRQAFLILKGITYFTNLYTVLNVT